MTNSPSGETTNEWATSPILRQLSPLIQFLGGPKDLREIHKVIEEFAKVLEAYRPIAKDSEEENIKNLQSIINNIKTKSLDISTYESNRNKSSPKTLKGYYQDHPHYSLYWHRPAKLETASQYRALQASLLPVWAELEKFRLTNPKLFLSFAYNLGLSLRQLTDCEGNDELVLLGLPSSANSPEKLLDCILELFETYHLNPLISGPNKKLVHICKVIEWFQTGEWSSKKSTFRQAAGTSTSHRKSPNHGAIETEGREQRVALPDFDGETSGIHIAKYLPQPRVADYTDEESFDPLLGLDANPVGITLELKRSRSKAYFLANRARIARKNGTYAAQAIEMRNQCLPVNKAKPTGYELKQLLSALANIYLPIWGETSNTKRVAIAAWAACRFYLSRDADAIRKLEISSSGPISQTNIVWRPQEKSLWLPVARPEHAAPSDADRGVLTVPTRESFSIAASGILLCCLERLREKSGRPFYRSYEDEFDDLLKRLNKRYQTNLTVHRVANFIRTTMSHMAPADDVIGQYFTGKPPDQHVPAIYSVVTQQRLQSLFEQACSVVNRITDAETPVPCTEGLPLLISDDEHHVGSLHVPRPETIRRTVDSLTERMERLDRRQIAWWVEAHNLYTAYVTFFLLSTTGVRLVSALLPAVFDIDASSGHCFISDKDDTRYSNARVIWLHQRLMDQFSQYFLHTTRVRQHLAMATPDPVRMVDARYTLSRLSARTAPRREDDLTMLRSAAPALFLIDQSGSRVLTVLPNLLCKYLGSQWKLRIGAVRHHIRSHLSRCGISGELINALLGHADRGQEPWGPYSTLSPGLWRQHVNQAVEPLLDSFHLRTISSPLIGGNR